MILVVSSRISCMVRMTHGTNDLLVVASVWSKAFSGFFLCKFVCSPNGLTNWRSGTKQQSGGFRVAKENGFTGVPKVSMFSELCEGNVGL